MIFYTTPELAHDVRLSLLKSRRGAAASASARARESAKHARSGLRGSMGKDSKKGARNAKLIPKRISIARVDMLLERFYLPQYIEWVIGFV